LLTLAKVIYTFFLTVKQQGRPLLRFIEIKEIYKKGANLLCSERKTEKKKHLYGDVIYTLFYGPRSHGNVLFLSAVRRHAAR
jgi:aspartate carbamoyltransferase catalytic subunit